MFIPAVRNSAIRNCCNYATAHNRRFDENERGSSAERTVRRRGRKKARNGGFRARARTVLSKMPRFRRDGLDHRIP